ncbi:EamA family transporter [Actinoplanes sp. TBRC 11911]|uniref:EamA family transporter n=1 Tax=Actinoplanes sp. TBRC 11911 TaxID=2729386 RepID=UPI00145DA14C|nr:EamA family transporter [Actinoplanes sp. TBRC 11911]NMO56193.1 EamA family transporter [Actinoplanes sp. TBRC 11911]
MTVSAAIAAVMWGASDFTAGVLARRLRVTTVLVCSKVFGMALSLPVLAFGDMPSAHDLRLAMAAGFLGLPALGLLYRAMRDGSLIIVAPVAAAAALVPVGWGLIGGERFGAVGVLGVAVALVGVTLASWPVERGTRPARLSTMVSALGAALGFGTYFVLLHQASGTEAYGVIAVSHLCGGAGALVLAAGLGLRKRQSGRRPAPALATVVAMCGVGALDVAGDIAFLVAAHGGPLGQAAVLASLYPAVTVLLNRSVLRERMHAVHLCGVLAALFAVACLAG